MSVEEYNAFLDSAVRLVVEGIMLHKKYKWEEIEDA